MNMYMPITHADLPAWYELSFDARRATIILRVHRDFIRNAKVAATSESPIVKDFIEKFGFQQFDGNFTKNFGFDRAFHLRNVCPDGFNEFTIKLPQVERETGEPCRDCKGTGKNWEAHDFRCFDCRGTGKARELSWHEVYAISASFTVFSHLAYCPDWGTGSPSSRISTRSQLLTVQTITVQSMHGGSLYGMFSIPLVRWLSRLPENTHLKKVEDAMKAAHNRMLGWRSYNRHEFRVRLQNEKGGLQMDCPGNACGLHPSDMFHSGFKEGYDFSCHNVDTPMQQLTLIAGLAALCDLARKEI